MRFDVAACPECGEPPRGVVESVFVLALLRPDDAAEGAFESADESKVSWDTQKPCLQGDKMLLQCEGGHEWESGMHAKAGDVDAPENIEYLLDVRGDGSALPVHPPGYALPVPLAPSLSLDSLGLRDIREIAPGYLLSHTRIEGCDFEVCFMRVKPRGHGQMFWDEGNEANPGFQRWMQTEVGEFQTLKVVPFEGDYVMLMQPCQVPRSDTQDG